MNNNPPKSRLLDMLAHITYQFGSITKPASFGDHPVSWKQVHGVDILEITSDRQDYGSIDGMWTTETDQRIGVVTADCVPLLIASIDTPFIAALHAGWRGSINQISLGMEKIFKSKNLCPSQLVAVIGPCIHACCYEVDQALAQRFSDKFGTKTVKGRLLDLPEVNRIQLHQMGIEQVEILPHCTFCSRWNEEPVFYSYRRNQCRERQRSVIQLTDDQ